MPIDTIHADVTNAQEDWSLVRDCLAGQRVVKEAGDKYLPKLKDQEPEEYDAYKERAIFVNATGRTHEAIMGLIFRKPPAMELGEVGKTMTGDADLRGKGLIAYARQVVAELAGVGRCGSLIDYSVEERRPYLAHYAAESILNWRVQRVIVGGTGRNILTLLVLAEKYELTSDKFNPTMVDAWRVYEIVDGHVEASVHIRDGEQKEKFLEVSRAVPRRQGAMLQEIPFVFHNAYEPGEAVGKSPMSDIAVVNVAHYRQSADHQNGLHICGIPTPYFFGGGADDDTDEPLYLGSSSAWTSSDPNASAGFIEFSGQGLGAIAASMTAMEGQMAALGARLIEPRRADAEAFDTVALRASAESSTLARIGQQATEGIVNALAWCEWWGGTAATVVDAADGWTFALNADFTSAAITAESLTAWGNARAANLVSEETYLHALRRGEAFPEGWTDEDETGSKETNPPMPPPLPGGPPDKKPPPAK